MSEDSGRTGVAVELPRVLAHIVTFNHESSVEGAVRSLLSQEGFKLGSSLEVLLTDNASSDGTFAVLEKFRQPGVTVQKNFENAGFSGAHNAGAAQAVASNASYLFVLNPDIALEPSALRLLVSALERDPSAGAAVPKLSRADSNLRPVSPARLDAAGMFITPAIRHLDRGSEELDVGQFDRDAYVFGGSGAAILLRVSTVVDVALRSTATARDEVQLFDDAFFAYREDADLAWRMQWLGWSTRYVASARGAHVRHVLPERRSQLAPTLNRFGVRNRFLLQLNNLSLSLAMQLLPAWVARNAIVIGAVLVSERSSMPALKEVFALRKRAWQNRRETLGRARVPTSMVRRWFANHPTVFPALESATPGQPIRSINIVIVNYNSGERLQRCLAAIGSTLERSTLDVVVTVVDNASLDSSASRCAPNLEDGVGERFSDTHSGSIATRIVFSPANLGFSGGVNRGVRERAADAYLIMNPDVELRELTLHRLAETLTHYPQLGLVSPVLVGRDGLVQHGFTARRFPTLSSTLAELFFLHRIWPKNPWTTAYRLQDDAVLARYLEGQQPTAGEPSLSTTEPAIVDQPAGACLLVRAAAFHEVNGFDEQFWPAWFEDVDFAMRARAAGQLAAIQAGAQADHEGGYSLAYLSASGFSEAWYSNLIRFWAKSGSRRQYLTLRALLPIALLVRAFATFLESVQLGLGRRPSEARNKRVHALTLFRLSFRR